MNARAGHFGGDKDNRGGYRDRWERPYSRRHIRQETRRETRAMVRTFRAHAARPA